MGRFHGSQILGDRGAILSIRRATVPLLSHLSHPNNVPTHSTLFAMTWCQTYVSKISATLSPLPHLSLCDTLIALVIRAASDDDFRVLISAC